MARPAVRLSVCLSSVCNVCIVAKRYVLSKNCMKKQIGLPDRYPTVTIGTPYDLSSPNGGTDSTLKYLRCVLWSNRLS